MVVAHRCGNDPTVEVVRPKKDLASRIRWRLREKQINLSFSRYTSTRPSGYERFSDDRSTYGHLLKHQLPSCDIINLHWIAGFVDYQTFFSAMPRHVPIFWRLSDMNAVTGGCHFDHGCGRYNVGCGVCPQIGSTDSRDLSHQIWQRKLTVLNQLEPDRLHIIALNRWMADVAARSPLLGKFEMSVIPNGVDTEVFVPRGLQAARAALGLPQDHRIVLFVADSVTNKRKGFYLLVQALDWLKAQDKLLLVSVGRNSPQIETSIPNRYLGHLNDDRQLAMVYSAADIFVVPSIQDNQPNTVLEAMACGTPVVGFDVGGIPEMIRSGMTGLLAPVGDATSLGHAISELLQCSDKRTAMASACRRIVMQDYRREMQVRRYADLYESQLRRRSTFP